MNEKFHHQENKKKKEPSSGLHRKQFLFASEINCTVILCVFQGEEALVRSRDQEFQKSNRRMHQELKTKNKNKSDEVDRIFYFLSQEASKSTSIKDVQEDSDEQIEKALKKFAAKEDDEDDDDDSQSVKKTNTTNKEESEVKEETPASDSSNDSLSLSVCFFFAKSSEEHNPHATVPIFHTQKPHAFIDNITSNKAITDENKEEMTLAFHDEKLAKHVIPYFVCLCLTNKTFTEIANSLL